MLTLQWGMNRESNGRPGVWVHRDALGMVPDGFANVWNAGQASVQFLMAPSTVTQRLSGQDAGDDKNPQNWRQPEDQDESCHLVAPPCRSTAIG